MQGIDTVIVRVSNIETSRDWYINKLELPSLWEDPTMKLVVLDTHSPTSLTLWQTDQVITVHRDTSSYPIFRTPDAHALRKELRSRGIETGELIQDGHIEYFFFFDPDGNVLEASHWRTHEGTLMVCHCAG